MTPSFFASIFKRSSAQAPSQKSSKTAKYYKILGIKPGASAEAVKAAYESQTKNLKADLEQFSYDHRLKARMEELIKELDEAYGMLTTISCPLAGSELQGDECASEDDEGF